MRVAPIGFLLLLSVGAAADAQVPISVGVRSGKSRAVSGARGADGGWSFDLLAAYRVNPTVSVYLMSGGADVGTLKENDTIDLSVFATSIGMTMLLGPLRVGQPAPWVGAGLGLYSLAASRELDELDEQSKTKLGVDLAAGVAIAMSPQLHFMPAVRFAMFTPDFTFEEIGAGDAVTTRSVSDMAYFTADVGFVYNFGVRRTR